MKVDAYESCVGFLPDAEARGRLRSSTHPGVTLRFRVAVRSGGIPRVTCLHARRYYRPAATHIYAWDQYIGSVVRDTGKK